MALLRHLRVDTEGKVGVDNEASNLTLQQQSEVASESGFLEQGLHRLICHSGDSALDLVLLSTWIFANLVLAFHKEEVATLKAVLGEIATQVKRLGITNGHTFILCLAKEGLNKTPSYWKLTAASWYD
jgi:hypothetical protein